MKKIFNIDIGNSSIEVLIIKKKKKNISLQVKPNLEVILSIPFSLSYSYGVKLIEDKKDWITEKLKKYSDLKINKGYYYLGTFYPLDTIKSILPKDVDIANLDSLEKWYLGELELLLKDSLKRYTKIMGVYPKKIKIKPLKSAWGICYSTGTITFNSNLIKTPKHIIDYLVVHELGHLKHPNHSKEYWNYISKFIENPKNCRKWLKNNGYKFNS